MWEAIRSLVALQDPSSAALHLPWLRSLSGRLAGLALEPVVVLIPPRGYMPDFLTPPPGGPLGRIDDDLDALRRTPVKQIRHDIELFGAEHPRSRISDAWLEHPRREVRRLADAVEGFWNRGIAPAWPRIKAFLDADITHRARRLAQGGPAGLFADLHPGVAWADDHLDVVSDREATIELKGRGLVLLPSAFSVGAPGDDRPRPLAADPHPSSPRHRHPLGRGHGRLRWPRAPARRHTRRDRRRPRRAALDRRRRTAVAAQPRNGSHHLTTLRDAGLTTARREGRTVLYVRTPTGDTLARR